jgi:PAS domain S-box-containing protein
MRRMSAGSVGMWIEIFHEAALVCDGGGRVISANSGACLRLGYSKQEIVGASFAGLLVEDGAWLAELTRGAASGPVTAAGRLHRKNGRILEAELTASECDLGGSAGVLVVLRGAGDSADPFTTLAPQISRANFQSIVANHPDGLLVVRHDGLVDYCNRAACEILHREEAGLPGTRFQVPESATTGTPTRLDMSLPDGVEVAVDLWAHPIQWGSEPAALVVFRDVTERVQTENALKASEAALRMAMKMEAVGRLAGGVAHDFNNLLTAITGFGRFALEQLPEGHAAREDLEEVLRASERAAALTQQLLAFSRRQIIRPRILDMGELVGNLKKLLCRMLGEDVEVVAESRTDLWKTFVDPGQIEQVVMNLAVNSRDAMPRGGQLLIRTANQHLDAEFCLRNAGARPGDYVLLEVIDEGVGMDAEVREHLFEPFFTTKEVGRGTGLGLATCYGTVKQAQGYIAVDSEVGRGTTVRVYLPRCTEETREATTPPGELPVDLPRGRECVLLVEDEPLVRGVALRILKKLGYRLLVAGDGREALAVAAREPGSIDLVVTDVVMPRMSGPQLAELITERRPEVKVLFMSGYNADRIVDHSVLRSGTAFLFKPFDELGLARAVRQILDGRPV